MIEARLIITNAVGLHARPAATLVKCAAKYNSTVTIKGKNKLANAKSIMAVLTMGFVKGDEIIITADGPDEEACIEELKGLFMSNFNEV
jgi:phosphotransferase system HPr (HPr) family protein